MSVLFIYFTKLYLNLHKCVSLIKPYLQLLQVNSYICHGRGLNNHFEIANHLTSFGSRDFIQVT